MRSNPCLGERTRKGEGSPGPSKMPANLIQCGLILIRSHLQRACFQIRICRQKGLGLNTHFFGGPGLGGCSPTHPREVHPGGGTCAGGVLQTGFQCHVLSKPRTGPASSLSFVATPPARLAAQLTHSLCELPGPPAVLPISAPNLCLTQTLGESPAGS